MADRKLFTVGDVEEAIQKIRLQVDTYIADLTERIAESPILIAIALIEAGVQEIVLSGASPEMVQKLVEIALWDAWKRRAVDESNPAEYLN